MKEQTQESKQPKESENKPEEFGGPSGLEPTRYGDWERKGRVSDF
ncbi:MAG: DUF1674 domain-containing protein [Alphaproteobacteria bacterium]|nr:DUF1674 domain-containing protein [Alphaproteobacteria bacterium]OJV15760.1 MAG: DUF1674 domain-containing protein [Alphaproteobacteria bacterium 33-17]